VHFLSRPRRPSRSGEWTPAKAVTFIVTLAASGSVTFAAGAAGMSRKSAYALRARDPAFAAAWAAAVTACSKRHSGPALSLSKGDKVKEVHEPPVSPSHGDMSPSRMDRELAFVRLVDALRDSPPLAHRAPAQ